MSMDPNPYAVSEPELLRSLRLSWRGMVSSRTTPDCRLFARVCYSDGKSWWLLPSPTG